MPTLFDVLHAHNLRDWGLDYQFNADCGRLISEALDEISRKSPANGLAFLPPGSYRIDTPIQAVSNVEVFGMGRSTLVKLGIDSNVDLVQGANLTGFQLRDLRLDGNRANNTSGNGSGVNLYKCTDTRLNNVDVVSCMADGVQITQGVRIKISSGQASDNGRHGVSVNDGEFCRFTDVESFDNGKEGSPGNGDGFNLDLMSHDNQFIGCDGFESSLAGVRQAYGFREVAGGGCYRNLWIGGACRGNLTASALVEPDSLFLSYLELLTGGLGFGTAAPNASAMIDLVSTTQGFGLPSMTTVRKANIASPRVGLAVYDSTLGKVCVWTGAAWETVTSS